MTIIALLTAIALSHFIKDLARIRRLGWLNKLVNWASEHLSNIPGWSGPGSFAILLVIPLIVLLIIGTIAGEVLDTLGYFIFDVVVLVYCFGPRDLDDDVAALIQAESGDEQAEAVLKITTEPLPAEEPERSTGITDAIFIQALRRWFAIIFWFALLGVVGAVLYRLAHWLVEDIEHLSDQQRKLFWRLREVMEWPVAQLMTLALAIAADFDSVFSAWKQYHQEQGHSLFEGNNGFLLAAARQVVLTGHAARDGFADQLDGPSACIKQAMDLVWRVLGVWLTVLAVLMLVGWIA